MVDFYDQRLVAGAVIIDPAPVGAFTPTCTQFQLPSFEAAYNNFKLEGVDEVWCVSVNDGFVMNAWQRELGIEKVKMIPDGNARDRPDPTTWSRMVPFGAYPFWRV